MRARLLSIVSVTAFAAFAGVGCENSDTTPPPLTAPPVSSSIANASALAVDSAGVASAPPPSASSAAAAASASGAASPSAPGVLAVTPLALPGASAPAFMDYLAYDRASNKVWVPVGNTGSVAVYDVAKKSFARVEGFKTAERDVRGSKRTIGPSAVAIGDGFAFIGNRATSEICPVDLKTMKLAKCFTVASPTDGVAYVASAKEVWVTTPRDQSLTVLDASKPSELKAKTVIKLEGATEGYAVDEAKGLFFTNLEDKDKTVIVDVKTHKPKSTWTPNCGSDGPRGVAVDAQRGFVIVACTDHVRVLDANKDGSLAMKLETGGGVDNVDYDPATHLLYVAAGKAAKLTVASLDEKGQLSVVATAPTAEGARNVVADASGSAYIIDPMSARLLVVAAPSR